MKLNDNTSVAMPIRNLLSIIIAVAFGVWAYFGVIARLTQVETSLILTEKDLDDLKFILNQEIDWIALSSVQKLKDIEEVKKQKAVKKQIRKHVACMLRYAAHSGTHYHFF